MATSSFKGSSLNNPGKYNSFAQSAVSGGLPKASGGTVTDVGNYTVHVFTSSGTFTVLVPSLKVEVFMIGGGSGGNGGLSTPTVPGSITGGGGAGASFNIQSTTLSTGSYSIVVGAGGSGGGGGRSAPPSIPPSFPANRGSAGNNTTFPGLTTALGAPNSPGSSTNTGSSSALYRGGVGLNNMAGGGGGIAGLAINSYVPTLGTVPSGSTGDMGRGGAGFFQNTFNLPRTNLAGGGGGGSHFPDAPGTTPNSGVGSDGGGAGAWVAPSPANPGAAPPGGSALSNSGAGGGGGAGHQLAPQGITPPGSPGGNGGSGVVSVRYLK